MRAILRGFGKNSFENHPGKRYHRKGMPGIMHGLKLQERAVESLTHPCCLTEGLFIGYIWLLQNHMQHQFYKTIPGLTTPSSPCGKAEKEKKALATA